MKAKKQKENAYTNGICVDLKTKFFNIWHGVCKNRFVRVTVVSVEVMSMLYMRINMTGDITPSTYI